MKPFSFKAVDPDSGHHKSPVDMVYVLDVKSNKILNMPQKIKKLGSKVNYYNRETEKWLKDNEDGFKESVKLIQEFDPNISMSVGMSKQMIKRYFGILFERAENFMERLLEVAGGAAPIIEWMFNKNNTPMFGAAMAKRRFEDYEISILLNQSNADFILPQCGLYGTEGKDGEIYQFIFPVTPQRAIILYNEKSIFGKWERQEKKDAFAIVKEKEVIEHYNKLAVEMEKVTGNSFVIAKTREELEKVLT